MTRATQKVDETTDFAAIRPAPPSRSETMIKAGSTLHGSNDEPDSLSLVTAETFRRFTFKLGRLVVAECHRVQPSIVRHESAEAHEDRNQSKAAEGRVAAKRCSVGVDANQKSSRRRSRRNRARVNDPSSRGVSAGLVSNRQKAGHYRCGCRDHLEDFNGRHRCEGGFVDR